VTAERLLDIESGKLLRRHVVRIEDGSSRPSGPRVEEAVTTTSAT